MSIARECAGWTVRGADQMVLCIYKDGKEIFICHCVLDDIFRNVCYIPI